MKKLPWKTSGAVKFDLSWTEFAPGQDTFNGLMINDEVMSLLPVSSRKGTLITIFDRRGKKLTQLRVKRNTKP